VQADLDNGYTRIANEILEALARLDLSGREFRVVNAIMRKTYGFQKRVDWISLDQLVELTGIAKENVSRVVTALCNRKIILKEGGGYTKKLGMNTKLNDWFHVEQIVENDNGDVAKRQIVEIDKLSETTTQIVEIDKGIVENDNGDVGFRQPQKKKETLPKEKKKNIYASLDFSGWPEKPGEQVWTDWKSHRAKKQASVTQTVINAMGIELSKAHAAGYSVDYCLAQQQEAGWQGFKFDWLLNRNGIRGSPSQSAGKRHNDFENRDYTAGVTPDGTF